MTDMAADMVFSTVVRCRARMQLVSAVRRAGITIPVTVMAVDLAAPALAESPARLGLVAGIAVGLAAVAAALPSVLQAPANRAAAGAIDARLQLQDRIV